MYRRVNWILLACLCFSLLVWAILILAVGRAFGEWECIRIEGQATGQTNEFCIDRDADRIRIEGSTRFWQEVSAIWWTPRPPDIPDIFDRWHPRHPQKEKRK